MMAGWRIEWRSHLLSNRESIVIVVWYAIYVLCYITSIHSIILMNKAVVFIIFIPTIVFYCLLGLVGEIFIGQQKLINFSVWIQWIAMIMSALISALKFAYDFPQWLDIPLVAVPSVVQFIGLSAFQVTAIQFGTDQLQGASSKHLTAFIYWYFCMEYLPKRILDLVVYLLSNYALVTEFAIHLGCCLLCVVLLSFVLCIKGCFMSHWFLGNLERGTACMRNRSQSDKHNPYSLVYRSIKFAVKHKHPLQRSAFTYWEDKMPSRIDLGKSKYGGPFTSEEVENVKIFLQLIKVLVSLFGIYIIALSIDLDMYHRVVSVSSNSVPVWIQALYDAVILGVFILLYTFLFLSCCHKCLPRILKRIWIGAMFTTGSALSMLLIESLGNENKEQVPCVMTLTPYLFLVPITMESGASIIFNISLFELIIAQSPQTMKGMLIGLFYTLRFGLAGLFILVEYHTFDTLYPTHGNALSCATAHYLEITFIGLLSLFVYTIVAYKYKPRERDEVVNVHIFAEEYYTK